MFGFGEKEKEKLRELQKALRKLKEDQGTLVARLQLEKSCPSTMVRECPVCQHKTVMHISYYDEIVGIRFTCCTCGNQFKEDHTPKLVKIESKS